MFEVSRERLGEKESQKEAITKEEHFLNKAVTRLTNLGLTHIRASDITETK